MQKHLLLSLISLPGFVLGAWGQKGILKGRITDAETKEPIPFANVAVKGTAAGASANMDGFFEIKVDPGNYTVIATAIGYQPFSQSVSVKAGETVTLAISLQKAAVQLEMFVKTEGKFEKKIEDLTVSLEVIKPNIIENKNATSAEQALQQTPGLVIVDSEPQLRGGSGYSFGAGSRVMVLVDDLPLLSGDAGRPSWGFIPVENIEQIEVVKGASSVLYGSAALNGVINIRTAFPKDKPLTKLTLFGGIYELPKRYRWYSEYGAFFHKDMPYLGGLNFLHAQKLGKNKNIDLTLGGNFLWEQGPQGAPLVYGPNKAIIDTLHEFGAYERRGRINFNFRHRISKVEGLAWGINGNILYGHSVTGLIWENYDSLLFRFMDGSATRTIQTVASIDPFITYQGAKGTSHSLRTRYFYVNNNNTDNRANASGILYGEYQARIAFPKLKDLYVIPGLMTSYTTGRAQLYAGKPPLPPTGYNRVQEDRIRTNAINSAAYVQLEAKLWKRLTLVGGARLEYFRVGKYDRYIISDTTGVNASFRYDTSFVSDDIQPVFRFGATVKAAEESYVRVSFGQGFRFPTIAERFIVATIGPATIYPNPDIISERSWSAELGFKQGFKFGQFLGYLDVAGFYQRFKNAVEFIAAQWGSLSDPLFGFGFRSVNIGPTRVAGVDVSLLGQGKISKNIGLNYLIGYTFMDPVSLDPDYVFGTDKQGTLLSNKTTSINLGQDNDSRFGKLLKYRFQHLMRADVEVTWKGLMAGVSARYNSFMRNIDNVFLNFEQLGVIRGLTESRNDSRKGYTVLDARLGYTLKKRHRLALICNNFTNNIYFLRPLSIEKPRQWLLQYQITI
ncbi:MAG: TonB-dependent receptor [Flavobacteriales bacterium]|nr:TonB-dependent receptor [Flavobacteriales bacterium]